MSTPTKVLPGDETKSNSAPTPSTQANSKELGEDLANFERQERQELDRQHQAEIARLRKIQSFD